MAEKTVMLDVADDGDWRAACDRAAKRSGAAWRLHRRSGPGGGNPLIAAHGTPAELRRFVVALYGRDGARDIFELDPELAAAVDRRPAGRRFSPR